MKATQREAIRKFFAAVEELKGSGVVRSDKYLADIAEFICASELNVELSANKREPGHDGNLDGERVQIKYHGGTATTVNCGDPASYEALLVVLGPRSELNETCGEDEFALYQIPAARVREKGPNSDGQFRLTKAQLPDDCFVGSV